MLHTNETSVKTETARRPELRADVPAGRRPDLIHPEVGALDPDDRRQSRRNPVIKSAKLIFTLTGAIHNCLVLDESPGGVLVDLGTMVVVPDDVTIQFANGATFLARRRWAAGTKCGLNFTGAQIISHETAIRMKKIADILRAQGLEAAISTLRATRFLDNIELRRAAEDVEAANARFEAALDGRLII
jgi:hypothetical protein